MRRSSLLLALVAILFTLPAGHARADDAETLTGEYVWSQRDSSGEIEAVFTPVEKERWDVSFHFTFRGKARTYSGTAEGSLSEGDLQGKVLNDDRERTFTFSGAFKDGVFHGTHAEIEDGRAQDTGTLTLSR